MAMFFFSGPPGPIPFFFVFRNVQKAEKKSPKPFQNVQNLKSKKCPKSPKKIQPCDAPLGIL
jgi:hypothetical protein